MIVLTAWAALQLTWVTMLIIVQMVQIAKATTTYENMRGHTQTGSAAAGAITAALTTGATSMEGAALNPNSAERQRGSDHGNSHGHRQGSFAQWKKLLGLDTFFSVAFGESKRLNNRIQNHQTNPFSSGIIGNCQDFWLDPAPYFGKREAGNAYLGRKIVNYNQLYESSSMQTHHWSSGDRDTMYHNVINDDAV